MSDRYKIREVHIEIRPGVTLIADLSSPSELKNLLKDLSNEKLLDAQPTKQTVTRRSQSVSQLPPSTPDDPASRIELRAGITHGDLQSSNVLAFKDDVPQLLRPGNFKTVSDATLVLLFAVETGLKTTSIDYDSFKALYEDQNLKSGSPLPMLLTNLRNAGYLDKKPYTSERKLRLTAKGERKAIDVLKSVSSQ